MDDQQNPREHALPLVLGLGNPILTDDRIGIEVAREVVAGLPAGCAVFCEAHVGGIELLHVLEGWRRVAIVDSLEPGHQAPGELRQLSLEELARCYTPITPHNAGLLHCLEFGRRCGLDMPEDLVVFAIGVCDPYTFGERCTEALERARPDLVSAVRLALFGPGGRWSGGCTPAN